MAKCTQGMEAKICSSGVGYYIGTFDKDGPRCRCSGYYKTRELAQKALDEHTFDRICPENMYCNRGIGCFHK